MAQINGVRTTKTITQDRRIVDMAKQIALLDPNEAPFITILKNIKETRTVINPEFKWLEDELTAEYTEVATAISSASTTTLAVDDGSIFRPGDIIKVGAENMLVTAISSNNLTVVRGYGTTAAQAAIAVDTGVYIIGNANMENAGARDAMSTQEVAVTNYTQIFKTPIQLSNTEAASDLYGGADRAYQRRKALIEHKRDICRSIYFGEKKEDTSGTAVRRTMAGLFALIGAANTVTFASSGGTALSYKSFDQYAALPAFSHGSKEKLLIAGPKLIAAINSWRLDNTKVDEVGTDKTWGVQVSKLVTSYGIMDVVFEPMFTGGLADLGLVLDMDNIRYVALKGRDTKLETNIQANDVDGVIDQYLTECSVECKQPKTHMIIKGAYYPS